MLRELTLAAAVAAGLTVAAPAVRAAVACPPTSSCATARCGAGRICVPSPKKCVTAPCPQYDCVSVIPLPMERVPAPRPMVTGPPAAASAPLPM
ncbi:MULTISPECIES: hypothetical protein [Streptosporangium]|uniref:Uncharacterized protein n=1 Tax=Streptosporangium brasiliense TaxID=47480 RepID=A0ABT9RCT7_9ACTN|nr:hypothetical protein [Streptosporangium brasiliense]MDP9866963.1 hypothetical protein [Streptosporangium brasiliense]